MLAFHAQDLAALILISGALIFMTSPYRIFWLLVLGFHAVVAAGAFWLLPGGFPIDHPRFWSNGVAPIVVLGAVILAVSAARRHRLDWLRVILAGFPVAWCAAALVLRWIFPITFHWIFAGPLAGAGVMGAAWVLTFRRQVFSPRDRNRAWAVALVAVLLGAFLPLSQRAPAPDTQPLDLLMPSPTFERTSRQVNGGKLNSRLWASPGDGTVMITAGKLRLNVRPLLSFMSRSPDRCATILAPPRFREGPELHLWSSEQQGEALSLWYRADYEAVLSVEPGPPEGPIVLEASARLTKPIFSHLNAFCDFEVTGHQRLALAFSPCPDTPIDVLPADYPIGRPLRLAYRDASDGFHVVEATSGEKGPFRELAKGTLRRLDSLGITLFDQGKPIATVVLQDWAIQGGVAPSPTAGWGVPVNAIEFSLSGDDPASSAGIYTTLAGTSVGRGWDSVGHAAGTYRNRLRVEFHDSEPSSSPP